MATGLFPFQHGVAGNDVDAHKKRAELDKPVQKIFHQQPSFIKLLTKNGYLAHQSGKWWEGSYKDGGFTHGMTHGDPKRGGRHGDVGLKIGRKGIKEITDFIDLSVSQKKPFLIWYAPFLPHTPHNPPERLLKKYTESGRAADVAKYYAMCEWFDETCGQLLGYLDKKNLTNNTVIIYICDNGWSAASTNSTDPNQKLWKSYALRSKGSPYEMGIRTPIMVSWPEKIKPVRTQDLAHAIDIFPTIASAAKLKAPPNLPGINLLNQMARKQRKIVFGVCHSVHNMSPGNPKDTLQYLWCVSAKWKFLLRYDGKDTTQYRNIHSWDTARTRLYDLKKDPYEKNDISAAHPEVVEQLNKKIKAWHSAGKISNNGQ
jgi:arylsulfatase A-like enzyme